MFWVITALVSQVVRLLTNEGYTDRIDIFRTSGNRRRGQHEQRVVHYVDVVSRFDAKWIFNKITNRPEVLYKPMSLL